MLGAIRDILEADSDVSTALTESGKFKVFVNRVTQDIAAPMALLSTDDTNPTEAKLVTSGMDRVRFSCDIAAETYAEASDIATKIRTALDNFVGAQGSWTFESVQFTGQSDALKDPEIAHVIAQTYTAYVLRDASGPHYPAGVNEPVTIQNSDQSYSETQAAGTTHNLPDVTHTDSDGSSEILPMGTAMVCTAAQPATLTLPDDTTTQVASGGSLDLMTVLDIRGSRPPCMYEDDIVYTGDAGYMHSIGAYEDTRSPFIARKAGANPYRVAADTPNPWGREERFTGYAGGFYNFNNGNWYDVDQVLSNEATEAPNGFLFDWLTGLCWKFSGQTTFQLMTTHYADIIALSWPTGTAFPRIAHKKEIMDIQSWGDDSNAFLLPFGTSMTNCQASSFTKNGTARHLWSGSVWGSSTSTSGRCFAVANIVTYAGLTGL